MSKPHYAALAAAGLLFLGLYFGLKTTPPSWEVKQQSRKLRGQQVSVDRLVEAAKSQLTLEERAALSVLEHKAQTAANDLERVEHLKTLSGWWYARGQWGIAGALAEEVAALASTDSAWSVAGVTYYQALQREKDSRKRNYYAERAIRAFESAASLAPDQPEHRVNVALVYAEDPPAENPMKAVQMLRDLERQYPQSAAVYNALGRLALKTGQWERAIERLEKALALDPQNPHTPCLLVKAYTNAGYTDKAEALANRCR